MGLPPGSLLRRFTGASRQLSIEICPEVKVRLGYQANYEAKRDRSRSRALLLQAAPRKLRHLDPFSALYESENPIEVDYGGRSRVQATFRPEYLGANAGAGLVATFRGRQF
jgi:hypothetical protein